MADDKKIDYGSVPITKLPPGEAYGARDLQRWSLNRAVGASGSGSSRTKAVSLNCPSCKGVTTIMVSIYQKHNKIGRQCRHCGKRGIKILKSKGRG